MICRTAQTPVNVGDSAVLSPVASSTVKSRTPVGGIGADIQNDPDLAEILAAWPKLPADVRKRIAELARGERM